MVDKSLVGTKMTFDFRQWIYDFSTDSHIVMRTNLLPTRLQDYERSFTNMRHVVPRWNRDCGTGHLVSIVHAAEYEFYGELVRFT